MEFVKFYLGYLINTDLDMYHSESDTPAVARTSSLVEELGQIDYIFSDKTGTLTCNVMDYKMSSIAGIGFATEVPEDKREDGWLGFDALKTMINEDQTEVGDTIREFFTLLAVCHTVIPECEGDEIEYQASSPDEAALVKGAKMVGFIFTVKPSLHSNICI